MSMKPLIVAMNNPISSDPRHALYPAPTGCAGHRLWQMFDEAYRRSAEPPLVMSDRKSRQEYIDGFERRNVLSARDWSMRDARAEAEKLLPLLAGRRVLVLGAQTADALRLDTNRSLLGRVWFERRVHHFGGRLLDDSTQPSSFEYWLAPHPSGRCREYNDPAVRARVGDLLVGMLRDTTD